MPSNFNIDNTTNIENQVVPKQAVKAPVKSEIDDEKDASKNENEESKVKIDLAKEVTDLKLLRYQSLWTIQNYLSNPLKVRLKKIPHNIFVRFSNKTKLTSELRTHGTSEIRKKNLERTNQVSFQTARLSWPYFQIYLSTSRPPRKISNVQIHILSKSTLSSCQNWLFLPFKWTTRYSGRRLCCRS